MGHRSTIPYTLLGKDPFSSVRIHLHCLSDGWLWHFGERCSCCSRVLVLVFHVRFSGYRPYSPAWCCGGINAHSYDPGMLKGDFCSTCLKWRWLEWFVETGLAQVYADLKFSGVCFYSINPDKRVRLPSHWLLIGRFLGQCKGVLRSTKLGLIVLGTMSPGFIDFVDHSYMLWCSKIHV